MSRLYGRLISDRRKTDATAGAYQRMWYKATWGSASDPREACHVTTIYTKESERPTVVVYLPDDVHYQVFVGDEKVGDHEVI